MACFEMSIRYPRKMVLGLLLAYGISGCGESPQPSSPGSDLGSLTGTHLSSNGIRSEVEDALVISYGRGTPLTTASIKLAQAYQTWFANASPTPPIAKELVLEELRLSRCIRQLVPSTPKADIAAKEVMLRTFNSDARLQVRNSILKAAGAFVLPTATGGCTS